MIAVVVISILLAILAGIIWEDSKPGAQCWSWPGRLIQQRRLAWQHWRARRRIPGPILKAYYRELGQLADANLERLVGTELAPEIAQLFGEEER